MKLYFRDNFFSSGTTDIENENREPSGRLDLRSAFSSSIDVYDGESRLRYSGGFKFLSGKWWVTGPAGEEIGSVRARMAFTRKRYEYNADDRGIFEITSPAFSNDYEVLNESGGLEARFEKISGWFQSGAYVLDNVSGRLDSYELVAVIMGVHQIQKAASSAAAT